MLRGTTRQSVLWGVRGQRVWSRLGEPGWLPEGGGNFERTGEFAVVGEAGHRFSFLPDLSCPKLASSGVGTWQRALSLWCMPFCLGPPGSREPRICSYREGLASLFHPESWGWGHTAEMTHLEESKRLPAVLWTSFPLAVFFALMLCGWSVRFT